MKEDTIFA